MKKFKTLKWIPIWFASLYVSLIFSCWVFGVTPGYIDNQGKAWVQDIIIKAGIYVDPRYYTSINGAVSAISTTQTTLVVSTPQTLTASLTIPSTLTLKILKGGSIVKASTYTLTINGPFEAGLHQAFSGLSSATGGGGSMADVTFGPQSVKEVFPEWWKENTSPGITDMLPAIHSAIASNTLNYGGVVTFCGSVYLVSNTIVFDRDNITLRGLGVSSPQIRASTPISPLLKIGRTHGDPASMITVKDMYLRQAGDYPTTVVHTEYCQNIFFENVRIDHSHRTTGSVGINLGTEAQLIFIRNLTYITADTGIKKTSPGSSGSDIYIQNCKFEHGGIDIRPTGNMYTLVISENSLTSLENSGQSGIYLSGIFWSTKINSNTIGSTARYGIYAEGITYGTITGNTIRNVSLERSNTYDAIYLETVSGTPVVGNSIDGLGNGRYGIVAEKKCDTLSIVANSVSRCSTGNYLIQALNSPFLGNIPSSIPRLENTSWPSVAASDRFLTGGPITITNFTNGYEGKIIHIISEHVINIHSGVNIFLNKGDFQMQPRDTLTLIQKADGKWYELSRSVNSS